VAENPFNLQDIKERALRLLKSPGTWAVFMGAAVILPFLGSAGLWDPWETHYAEVARRMVVDGDWITPRWRNELFFSKPVLIFWMMASSFSVFGISALAARIPFAIVGILGVYLAYRTVSRLTDSKKGLWAAFVMATSPFYFFIARQAITDIVFCVFMLGALGCFLLVALEEKPRLRDVLGIYIFAGLAALGKTPVGLAIPFLVVLGYLFLSGDWRVLKKLKLHIGIPVFFVIAAPWYIGVLILHGKKFFNEFFLHHNIQRAFTGVHGDRATFEYFIKQMGYGFFPWVALIPVAFGRITARLRGGADKLSLGEPGPATAGIRLDLFLLVWFAVTFATFSLIVTKFHHYVFPALPPLALLVGLALAERDAVGWRFIAPLGVLLLAMVANDIVSSPAHISNLCTYAYDRQMPEEDYPRGILLGIAAAVGAVLIASHFVKRMRLAVWALAGIVAFSTIVLAWVYIPRLGDTLSQEGLFRTYERVKKPGDKLYQYQMNWRGEVFYSADTIIKLSSESSVRNVLKQDARIFIVSVSDGFAAVDRIARLATGKHLHVLPGSNERYTLASNRIDEGMQDFNPLAQNIFKEPPPISHPVRAEFEEGVAFLGYDVNPEKPGIGGSFELTLYFEALKTINRNWQVFVHVDGHGHEFHRLNGDHYPLKGLFPTNRWLQGDIIRDTVKLSVPIEFSAERYTIYLGLFIGNRRMKVLPGFPQDGQNRVRAGTLTMD
jgi:4-amino-4-deoxy-L-arabinose transferase-like glycosyltransferase